ncbi:MAG TPA: DUF6600 domain-containing protein [Pyrinomonadaceae bacterium]|nr:DUF6600 domain-containing protein [Pyrinomonadaceae bacterium]
MRHLRTIFSTSLFLLFLLLATFTVAVRADDEKDADEYDETARVARVTLIRGDVQLKRADSRAWETAHVNLPLVEGDTLATTGQDARLEIQIDARNFVRIGPDSVLRIVTLRDEGVALSLSEGVATVRLARFDHSKEYFEVDAPDTTLAAEKRGFYRIDVSDTGSVRLTVRDEGQARIYSETSGFTLRDGHTAELVSNGNEAGDWRLDYAVARDNWDTWVDERERYLASNLHFDGRDVYYDTDVWGAEELDAYGEWVNSNDYGWVWRPFSTATSSYTDWAPYRYGHWVWCPPYGWTWVADEPWGWAPYHYGRWVYYQNNWCWVPRVQTQHRNWWRPALVVFVYVPTSNGERVCWYPLAYGQHDPRSRHYQRLEALRSNDLARLQRTNPASLRAITSVPARDFGRRLARPERAPDEIARRAVTTEPVRGRLPITPSDDATNRAESERRTARTTTARPSSSTGLTRALPERPTGAATRLPGVALDGELRRTRLYNGREPRTVSGVDVNGAGSVDSVNTGAVARPSRVRSEVRPAVERGNDGNSATPLNERPARPPARMNPGEGRVVSPNVEQPSIRDSEPEPRRRPVSPARNSEGSETPQRPPRREERPETRPEAKPEPERRPEPRYSPRPERIPESRPEPRPESRPEPSRAPESRPEPRSEPKQESRPEPKQEAPPRREESKPAEQRREDAPARVSKPDNR